MHNLRGRHLRRRQVFFSHLCSPRFSRLLSNNKITGLRSGAFLGLSLLEKL